MSRPAAPWRSYLFVPVLSEKFIAGAATRGADAIILDLEDAIPQARKADARAAVADVAARLAMQGCDVVVRINRPWTDALPDLLAAVGPNVCAIAAPKVPNAGHVIALSEIIEAAERAAGMEVGTTGVICMIETSQGLGEIRAIAQAQTRVAGLIVGAEDLAAELGAQPTPDLLHTPNVMAVLAAREAGCAPIGYVGSVANFTDLDAFAATIRQARAMGFVGGFCIHPAQVPILNEGFSPSPDEVSNALKVTEAFDQALARGEGAVQVDGRMIDLPIAERARAVLKAAR